MITTEKKKKDKAESKQTQQDLNGVCTFNPSVCVGQHTHLTQVKYCANHVILTFFVDI